MELRVRFRVRFRIRVRVSVRVSVMVKYFRDSSSILLRVLFSQANRFVLSSARNYIAFHLLNDDHSHKISLT